jgi:hypothetical protein
MQIGVWKRSLVLLTHSGIDTCKVLWGSSATDGITSPPQAIRSGSAPELPACTSDSNQRYKRGAPARLAGRLRTPVVSLRPNRSWVLMRTLPFPPKTAKNPLFLAKSNSLSNFWILTAGGSHECRARPARDPCLEGGRRHLFHYVLQELKRADGAALHTSNRLFALCVRTAFRIMAARHKNWRYPLLE